MINYCLHEIDSVAKKLIQSTTSKLLLFNGDMGVGKTTLIKTIVKELGSNDEVSSPTFSIVNEYKTKEGNSIYHFDLYRLESLEEAMDFGIEEYLYSGSWCLIEWPDLIKESLDTSFEIIEIYLNKDKSRSLKLMFNQRNNAPNHVL